MSLKSDYQWVWRFISITFVIGLALTLNFLDSMHVVFPSLFRMEESMYEQILGQFYLLIVLFAGAVLVDYLIGRFSRGPN